MPTVLCRKNKICLAWNPKCGCTHIKQIFYMLRDKLDEPISNSKDTTIHQYEKVPYVWNYPEDNSIYTLILVMRNPYHRLVSGFLDKYHQKGQFRHKWPKDMVLSFSNFVDELLKKNSDLIDLFHFFPQVDSPLAFQFPHFETDSFKEVKIMDLNNIDYSYLEKKFEYNTVEEAKDFHGFHTFTRTQEKFGTGQKNWTQILPEYSFKNIMNVHIDEYYPKNYVLPYEKFYTPELEEKVRKFFKTDFQFALLHKIDYETEFQENKLKCV